MANYSRRQQLRSAMLLATAATVALLSLAACGGGAEEPNVASANPSGAAATGVPATDVVGKYVESKRQWVKCLREQGFDLPDPDARGFVDMSGQDSRKLKANPKWVEAQKKCEEFQLPVPAELEEKVDPPTPEQLANRREYARCMRANGVSDWPDPNANGEWPNWNGSHDDATMMRALQICEPVLDGRAPTTPDPSKTARG